MSQESAYMCVSGIPVMIKARLSCSMLTHECSFKCLLPWKQAAGTQVWYTDNGLSLFISLCHSPSFSLSLHPAALPIVHQFSISPHPFILSASWLDFHSFLSVSRHQGPPPLSHSLLFIQSDIFTSVSIHSCQPCSHPLTCLSLSLITLSSCHVILFVSFPSSISVYLCFIAFISFHLYPGLSVNLCIWRAPVHKNTQMLTEHRNNW